MNPPLFNSFTKYVRVCYVILNTIGQSANCDHQIVGELLHLHEGNGSAEVQKGNVSGPGNNYTKFIYQASM